ncbi:MAG: hypothetical protein V4579_07860 [Pseudomonadota bacterium]
MAMVAHARTRPPGRPEPHLRAAAGLLTELAAQIEALGARLCTDPAVVSRHITELQAIDLIAQKQLHLAELLLADCPYAAVEAMRVEDVKRRIGQSLG